MIKTTKAAMVETVMITTMGTMESLTKHLPQGSKAPKPNWIAPIKAEALPAFLVKAQV
jgi:hypothetical protein